MSSDKVIPPLKHGALGVHFTKSAQSRRSIETRLARRVGERKVVGRLLALSVLNKHRNPVLARKAKADAHYIAGSFVGRSKTQYPTGFRRKK